MDLNAARAEMTTLLSLRDGLTHEPGIQSRLGARRYLEARYGRATSILSREGLLGMPSKKKWRTL